MADNTNPAATKLSNEVIRLLADDLTTIYQRCKRAQDLIAAAGGLNTLFPNTADSVIDGSGADRRLVLTNQQIRAAVGAGGAFVTLLEANTNAHLNACLLASNQPRA